MFKFLRKTFSNEISSNHQNNLSKLEREHRELSLDKQFQNNIIAINNLDEFEIHPNLVGLLWIGDGTHKNYETNSKFYENDFFTVRFTYNTEPSTIYITLQIYEPSNPESVIPPGYYPSYAKLSPEQRWTYLKFLKNPFASGTDIGYVFILYYGLERHLIEGNYSRAFDLVLNLREVHKNNSFIAYSTCALIISSVIHQRTDNLKLLLKSNKNNNIRMPESTYVIVKAILNEPLTAVDFIDMHKQFGFRKNRYIGDRLGEFINIMNDLIAANEVDTFPRNYISKESSRNLYLVFANISFETREVKLPDLFEEQSFKQMGFDLLKATTEIMRQSNKKSGLNQNRT